MILSPPRRLILRAALAALLATPSLAAAQPSRDGAAPAGWLLLVPQLEASRAGDTPLVGASLTLAWQASR